MTFQRFETVFRCKALYKNAVHYYYIYEEAFVSVGNSAITPPIFFGGQTTALGSFIPPIPPVEPPLHRLCSLELESCSGDVINYSRLAVLTVQKSR